MAKHFIESPTTPRAPNIGANFHLLNTSIGPAAHEGRYSFSAGASHLSISRQTTKKRTKALRADITAPRVCLLSGTNSGARCISQIVLETNEGRRVVTISLGTLDFIGQTKMRREASGIKIAATWEIIDGSR